MRMSLLAAAGAILAGFFAAGVEAQTQRDVVPAGSGRGTLDQRLHGKRGGGKSAGPIGYHGGPVLDAPATAPVNVYLIWYGNWSGNTATAILPDFLSHLGGSPYFNINTTYYEIVNGIAYNVENSVHYSGSVNDNYSRGANLNNGAVAAIVANAISNLGLPEDPNGVYFVLTSQDVKLGGFCGSFCAWHTHGTIGGADLKYAFVGNPDRCPSACEVQSSISPNDNPGADGMADSIAHELEESVTDPDFNAWYFNDGEENADKCAWTYGQTYTTGNGSTANMKLGGRDYLIQQNWVNQGAGFCALSF
jgi:hypothetical protein